MSEEVKQAVEVWFIHIGDDEPKYLSVGELAADRDNITVLIPPGYRDIVKSHVDALWGITALEPRHSVRLIYDVARGLVKWPGGRYQIREQESSSWLEDDGYSSYWNIVPYKPEIEVLGIRISRPDLLRHPGASAIGMQYDEQEITIEVGGRRNDLYFLLGLGHLYQHAAAGWMTKTTYEIKIDEPFSKDCKTTLVDHLVAMGMFTDEAASAIRELQEGGDSDACCSV